jgi:hypothetical protein
VALVSHRRFLDPFHLSTLLLFSFLQWQGLRVDSEYFVRLCFFRLFDRYLSPGFCRVKHFNRLEPLHINGLVFAGVAGHNCVEIQ